MDSKTEGEQVFQIAGFNEDALPKFTWWVLGLTAVLLLIVTVTAIGFISAGAFDPQVVGELQAEYELETLSVANHTQNIHWLAQVPGENFSLRLTAAYKSGEHDSGYGLIVGDNQGALAVLVSPLGYTAVVHMIPQIPMTIDGQGMNDELDSMIFNGLAPEDETSVVSWPLRNSVDSGNFLMDWQTWPHVETGQETNEIWLDTEGDHITIQINREIFMTGRLPISSPKYMGIWLGSFNDQVTISFHNLQIYSPSP